MNKQDNENLIAIIDTAKAISGPTTSCSVSVSNYKEEVVTVYYAIWNGDFNNIERQITWYSHDYTIAEILQYLQQIQAAEPRMEQAA